MNEVIVHQGGSSLAISPKQSDWTPEQAQAMLGMFNLGGAPVPVLQSYFHICQTTGLDPFKRQIHLIERQGKWTPQTSIDGFRIIRDRSGVYDGDETLWCGDDGVWVDAWIKPEPPTACKFNLYVKGRSRPVTAVARWVEYVQTRGKDGAVTHMWAKMAAHMLAKVAEALAIRKAFPDDTGGLYTDDEMAQALNDAPATGATRKASPGIMDLEAPPAAAPTAAATDAPGPVGAFLDPVPAAAPEASPAPVDDPNIEDAVVVADEPVQPSAEPVPEAGPPMDMDPAPNVPHEHAYTWAQSLAEAIERPDFNMVVLREVFDNATAAGALGEPVPWSSLKTLDATIQAIRANIEAGAPVLDGVA